MSKKPILGACLLASFLVGILIFQMCCGKGAITQYNYDRIEIGMAVSDVEAILGTGQEISHQRTPKFNNRVDENRHSITDSVTGDRFFQFPPDDQKRVGGKRIFIRVVDNKVSSKFFVH